MSLEVQLRRHYSLKFAAHVYNLYSQMTLMQRVCWCRLWRAASRPLSLNSSNRCRRTAASPSQLAFMSTLRLSECRGREKYEKLDVKGAEIGGKKLTQVLFFFLIPLNYLGIYPTLAAAVFSNILMRIRFFFDIIKVLFSLCAYQEWLMFFKFWCCMT